ncbi:MAG: putative transposase [Haloquadratum walsbyi J07HQW2]|jgi:Probable transposase.|uniref:Putative transposase n=1 Tax=Haloquadratum walsbyi J07HQW2 TaxID=1238425 RepID=U1NCG7_9EURY|nr:MAG: putative transposase [Haloquadratum walsbyi J07HQW2]
MHIKDSIKAPQDSNQNGYNVGSLNWKLPNEYRSFTCAQSGFEFDRKNGQTVLSLSLSKLVDIPITVHREIRKDVTVTVKEVSIKKEQTGEWYASFAVENKEEPAKPDNPDRCIGTDVGIIKCPHDTDGRAVGSRSNNWGKTTVEDNRVPPATQAEAT